MATTTTAPPAGRWPLFLMGGLLFIIGPALYFVQIQMRNWAVPWYMPGLATLGVLLMAISVWQRRGIVRPIGLALFVLICGFEWFALLVATRTPEYVGPAQPGRQVPEFSARLASGSAFTDKDLAQGNKSLLLFYRGRW